LSNLGVGPPPENETAATGGGPGGGEIKERLARQLRNQRRAERPISASSFAIVADGFVLALVTGTAAAHSFLREAAR
jgi:hypothetical protein